MSTTSDTHTDGPSEAQSNGDIVDSPPAEASAPDCWYYCDCCSRKVPRHEVRHNCHDCHDFDYCENCISDAALIHPGHSFTKLDALEPPPELEGDDTLSSEKKDEEPYCPSCAPVTATLPLLHFVLDPEKDPKAANRQICVKWQLRISSLIEATQRDCAFCCFFLHTFFRAFNGEAHEYTEKSPWYVRPSEHDTERMELVKHCMGTLTRLKNDRFDFEILPSCPMKGVKPWDFDKLKFSLSDSSLKYRSNEELKEARVFHSAGVIAMERFVFTTKDDPAAQHISSRPPNPSPGSPQSLEQIKTWMRDCEQNHGSTCRPSPTGAPPSRVLDVSDLSALRLHQTDPSPQQQPSNLRYAALSYCWGDGPQTFQTTTATLPDRLNGPFPLTALPLTLQDAVRVVHDLGIRHLWIDALCIVQDDAHDKFAELARMSDIYKNAFLTLIAARARTADEGFLQDRADAHTGLWKALVPLAYPLADERATSMQEASALPRPRGKGGRVYLLEESAGMSATVKDPVSERAWCLQERVLSPRVVSYGRWPTWRCNRAVASDGGFYVQDGNLKEGGDAAVRRLTNAIVTTNTSTTGRGLDHFRTAQMMGTWRGIVEDYTKRKLAFTTDRLLAIAGIAREIGRLTGMEYLAGLWRENMLHDLMWYARTQEWRMRLAHTNEFPRAPTWSWASVDAPILVDAVTEDSAPLARVLGCSVEKVEGKSTYDIVASGTVEIQGPFAELKRQDVLDLLKQQNFAPAPPMSNDVQEWYKQMLEDMATRPRDGVSMDDVETELPDRVFGLLLFERDWTKNKWDETRPKVMEACYSGLLLREVEAGRYERIGAFWNDTSEFVDQAVKPWGERAVVLV
ncbi:heterokaryon incompatibility protein 6 [Chaetomidium leptoderma]|uniref:Heterokaryon incompatibility protein 6 n=1 Tax=Chaetomidium leptoderma TaxID=669021 RepID=A0AAN6VHC5_9PEZI|nr:heterokaryon incompatibility protein 6 [Chaetomidium leptoderma]